MSWLSIKEAKESLSLCAQTIYGLCDDETFDFYLTKGGHRRISSASIETFLQRKYEKPLPKPKKIAYIRVSSKKQINDLERQREWIKERCPDSEIKADVGSGLNYKRREFQAIIDLALKGISIELSIAHRDRLVRFGFELVEKIIKKAGGSIYVLGKESEGEEGELANEVLDIIQVFTARRMGRRSYRKDRSLHIKLSIPDEKDSTLFGSDSETDNEEVLRSMPEGIEQASPTDQ